jgi:hypothetical protein
LGKEQEFMKIRIDVNATDIEQGIQSNCTSCPIAIATVRALKEKGISGNVRIGEHTARIFPFFGNIVSKAKMPAEARAFIKVFDENTLYPYTRAEYEQVVRPFSFDLHFKTRNKMHSEQEGKKCGEYCSI